MGTIIDINGVIKKEKEKAKFNAMSDDQIVSHCYKTFIDCYNLNLSHFTSSKKVVMVFPKNITLSLNTRQRIIDRFRQSHDAFYAIDIFENQIFSICETIVLLLKKGILIDVEGAAQLGKTGYICAVACVWNAVQSNQKSKEFIFISLPNKLTISAQTLIDYAIISDFLSNIMIKGQTIGESNNHLFNDPPRIQRKLNNSNTDDGIEDMLSQLKNEQEQLFQKGYKGFLVIMDEADEACQADGYLDRLENKCREMRIKARFVFVTATNWETRSLTNFHHVVMPIPDSYSGLVSKNRTPIISWSTLAELIGLPSFSQFEADYNKGGKFYKENDKGKKISVRPAPFNISTDYNNTSFAEKIIEALSQGINPFARARALVPIASIGKRADRFVLREFFAYELGFNGKPFNGGQGMVMRYGNSEVQAEALRDQLLNKKFNPHLSILRHDSQSTEVQFDYVKKSGEVGKAILRKKRKSDNVLDCKNKFETVGEMISLAQENGANNYLVVVSAQARRGDRFPSHTTCFIDLSTDFTNMTAGEQGLLGRGCGHYKIIDGYINDQNGKPKFIKGGHQSTMVVLSDISYMCIAEYRYTYDSTFGKKIPTKNPSKNSIRAKKPNTITNHCLMIGDDTWKKLKPTTKKAIIDVVSLMENNIVFSENGKRPRTTQNLVPYKPKCKHFSEARPDTKNEQRPQLWHYYDLFGLLGDKGIADLEQAIDNTNHTHGTKLLLPNVPRMGDKKTIMTSKDFVKFSMRSMDDTRIQGDSHSQYKGLPTLKNNAEGAAAKTKVQMASIIDHTNKRVVGLTFMFKSLVLDYSDEHLDLYREVLPIKGKKDREAPYYRMASGEQQEASDKAVASKRKRS